MERIRERNFEQNAWNGFEKRNPQFKWYRVITDELRLLKHQVKELREVEGKIARIEDTMYLIYTTIKAEKKDADPS